MASSSKKIEWFDMELPFPVCPVNIAKFLKEELFIEHFRWLLLYFFKSN